MAASRAIPGPYPGTAQRKWGDADPSTSTRQKGSVEVWSHVIINDGIELTVDPKRANLTPEQVRELAAGVMELYEKSARLEGFS